MPTIPSPAMRACAWGSVPIGSRKRPKNTCHRSWGTLLAPRNQFLGSQTGTRIEPRPKLEDQSVEWCQVASDQGQDDGPLKRSDDHGGEIVGALEWYAELGQAFRERFEPTVECASEHLSKLLAASCRVRGGSNCTAV